MPPSTSLSWLLLLSGFSLLPMQIALPQTQLWKFMHNGMVGFAKYLRGAKAKLTSQNIN